MKMTRSPIVLWTRDIGEWLACRVSWKLFYGIDDFATIVRPHESILGLVRRMDQANPSSTLLVRTWSLPFEVNEVNLGYFE